MTVLLLLLLSLFPSYHQASAFVLFPDLKAACDAVLPLKQHKVAVAVELHDWASLR